ncbi:MAG: hybrid sensor histidine kinase/response regulator [Desulfobacter sp.]|nr:MAG: hybrid sensor histidine kinase/response regulator [Desulfobacter sp.]
MNEKSPYAIMIVDDIESEIDILMACLGDSYRVRVALDGPSALEDIKETPPDLILLDILMPGMDGYEVCRLLKADERTREIPLLFVTSLTEAEEETRGFELGGVDYITKPFNFSVIRARVKTHLELAEARKGLKRQNAILKENIMLREQVEHVTRHDLKNPLQVVMGTADMLLFSLDMGTARGEMTEMIENQLKACDTMLNMINRSMNLYKMENNSYDLVTRPTDIIPVLDRIFIGVNDLAARKSLAINLRINNRGRLPGDRFELTCEELLFYSMMSNLVHNAMSASPENEIVTITLESRPATVITVENRGVVPPPVRDRFFEKFVTSDKEKGTGLGTYSAKMIAEIHDAQIDMETSDAMNLTMITIKWP